jgi:hypothetical protein
VLLIKRGDFITGTRLLRAALDELREARFVLSYTEFLGELAEGLTGAGQVAQGLLAIDEALARSDCWCLTELLRMKGELVLLEGAPTAVDPAED